MIVGWAINPVGLGAVGYGRVWSGTVGFGLVWFGLVLPPPSEASWLGSSTKLSRIDGSSYHGGKK